MSQNKVPFAIIVTYHTRCKYKSWNETLFLGYGTKKEAGATLKELLETKIRRQLIDRSDIVRLDIYVECQNEDKVIQWFDVERMPARIVREEYPKG